MDTHAAVAHVAFQLGFGRQSRDRVDDNKVHRAGPDKRINDFQRLLAGVGLRNQQLIQINAQLLGVYWVERMLRIDKGANAAFFLFLGHSMQRQCRLTRTFRAVDFNDPAFGQAADPKRDIQPKRAGRGRLDLGDRVVFAQFHNRAFAELTFDLGQSRIQCFLFVGCFFVSHAQNICRCHVCDPYSTPDAGGQLSCMFASCSHSL